MNWLQRVFLLQADARAPLYHFTAIRNAYNILKTDVLRTSTKWKDTPSISLTRDKNHYLYSDATDHLVIRFVIDQDKLRQSYKVDPYFWKGPSDAFNDRGQGFSESEEIVYKNIKNFSKYLKRTEVVGFLKYMNDKENFENAIIKGEFIDGTKKAVESNPKMLKFGKFLVSPWHDYWDKLSVINNEVFYLNFFVKKGKLKDSDKKIAKKYIKNWKFYANKAFELAGLV